MSGFPIALEVGQRFHLNTLAGKPLAGIPEDGHVVVFTDDEFDGGKPIEALIESSRGDMPKPSEWPRTFIAREQFDGWIAKTAGKYLLAKKTANGRYTVEKIHSYDVGTNLRFQKKEKSGSKQADAKPKHDETKHGETKHAETKQVEVHPKRIATPPPRDNIDLTGTPLDLSNPIIAQAFEAGVKRIADELKDLKRAKEAEVEAEIKTYRIAEFNKIDGEVKQKKEKLLKRGREEVAREVEEHRAAELKRLKETPEHQASVLRTVESSVMDPNVKSRAASLLEKYWGK